LTRVARGWSEGGGAAATSDGGLGSNRPATISRRGGPVEPGSLFQGGDRICRRIGARGRRGNRMMMTQRKWYAAARGWVRCQTGAAKNQGIPRGTASVVVGMSPTGPRREHRFHVATLRPRGRLGPDPSFHSPPFSANHHFPEHQQYPGVLHEASNNFPTGPWKIDASAEL